MYRPRIIPVLLLKNKGLYKSFQFKDYTYIGDPINAVRLFNEFQADELIFLDIEATKESRCISPDFIREVGEEANMPFAAGGGIRTLEQIKMILKAGAEKVVLGSQAVLRPEFIKEAAEEFGSSTIVVCMDVAEKIPSGNKSVTLKNTRISEYGPVEFALNVQRLGAGEIIVQSVDRDGTMQGYDKDLIQTVSDAVTIPVVALGGAANLKNMKEVYSQTHVCGLAAGSMFVFHGKNRAVLINYPEKNEIKKVFSGDE